MLCDRYGLSAYAGRVMIFYCFAKITNRVMKGGQSFMNINLVKALGTAATLMGIISTVIADWANERKQDAIIEEKVSEALNRNNVKENEDEE